MFFFSRFFWNLFQSWNISTALSLQSEVILEGFISHVCYPLRVCQAEMNTVHVLSSGPPSCHLGVGMSIKVKRWFEVGPNWQSFAQIRDVKRPKIIKDDQTSGRKLYFYVFPHLHSYIFSTFFCFLSASFLRLPTLPWSRIAFGDSNHFDQPGFNLSSTTSQSSLPENGTHGSFAEINGEKWRAVKSKTDHVHCKGLLWISSGDRYRWHILVHGDPCA